MKKVNFATPPDKWSGWRYDNERNIDYSIDNREYLQERKEFLMKNVIDEDSDKILKEIESYSNRQILAWGCGSGKTTKIKYFCANTNSSVLVVVKTNEEVKKLVFDIKALNPNQHICGFYDNDYVIRNLEQDITYLQKFKIVICNNWHFLSEPRDLFMIYKNKTIEERKYILFDEYPEAYKPIIINSNDLISYIYKLDETLLTNIQKNFNNINIQNKFLNEDFYFKVLGIKSKSNLSRLRGENISKKLFNIISAIPKILKETEIIEIVNDINSNVKEESKIIILDATGHIVFNGVEYSDWVVNEYKKNKLSIKNVSYFTLHSSRKSRKRARKQDDLFKKDIENLKNFLRNSNSKKHLIVTWKNSAHSDDLPRKIREYIGEDLSICYHIIYYNSGECRATNEYKDYDSIIFFGEWFYNRSVAEKLSKVFNTNISSENIALSEIIQAIFRTRARDNLPIELTFFYNINKEHKNINKFDRALIEVCSPLNYDIINFQFCLRQAEYDLYKQTYDKILKFIEFYNVRSIGGKFNIRLSEIKNLMGYKSLRDTKPLVTSLEKYLKIELVIKR